ncbi:MAG: restriction endonuclease subunit S [Bacilli bacterium]
MNVPKLRFKEFNDEYINLKYKDVLKIKSGKDQKQVECESGIYPILGTGGQIGKTNSFLYDKPSVLIGRKGTINKPQYMETPFWTVDTLFYSHIYEPNIPKYLFYSFQNVNWKKYDESTGVPSLSSSTIESVECNIPSKEEQLKIADFLSLLDKKIDLQTKKIEDLKLFKKGLIKDFYNEYNLRQIKIKEIGKIVTGTTPSKSINSYWDNGNITWVTPTDINDSRDINDSFFKITDTGLDKGKFIPKNSVLVTCIASIGKNAILKVDGSCNQQINAIIPNKNFNYNYVYYLIESISNYMKSIAGTSATSIINKEEFSKIIVKVHSKEKQDYIASVLSQFEIKILLEISKLNKFYQLKKSLMQNMFV